MSRVEAVSNSELQVMSTGMQCYTKQNNEPTQARKVTSAYRKRMSIILSYAYLGDDVDLVAPGHNGHVVAFLHYLGLAQLHFVVTHRHL